MKLQVPDIIRIDHKTLRVTLLLGNHAFVSDIVENEAGDAYNFQTAEANILVNCCGFLRAFNLDYLFFKAGHPRRLPWDYGEISQWSVDQAMERIARVR